LAEECLSALPFLLVHGQRDDVVPFSALAQAEQSLRNAKLPVSTLVCPGLGHSIDNAGLSKGLEFLRTVLA
jgi:phospholipase/carboxylesterase